MNEWLDNILLNYVTFVSLFSPPATITAATIILGRIDRNILWQIAWKIAAGYTLVMLVVIWLGNWLLTALGLSADALTFLATGPLHGRLSPGVMDTLARISGIILVTLAIQLLVSGMVGLITTNLKHLTG